ncbi:MAG: hypothetical protein F6K00_24345 [Leptolyngbya sp. SIOISBB]|nr:hypothetical protein [Leptolyngbya sp. SIOISBB]
MDQLKFALGPYEFFASIIGGSPLVIVLFLLFNPIAGPQDLFLVFKNNLSTSAALMSAFISYLLGGGIQGVSWRYFLALCRIFKRDYGYFGDMIPRKHQQLPHDANEIADLELDFEDRLVLLLREKTGIPQKLNWLDARLTSYLKENGSQAPITAELHLVNHIMYRNLSLGFLILSLTFVINTLRVQSFILEQSILILLLLGLSYAMFFRSLSFKKWHNRELLLGFYFSARRTQHP